MNPYNVYLYIYICTLTVQWFRVTSEKCVIWGTTLQYKSLHVMSRTRVSNQNFSIPYPFSHFQIPFLFSHFPIPFPTPFSNFPISFPTLLTCPNPLPYPFSHFPIPFLPRLSYPNPIPFSHFLNPFPFSHFPIPFRTPSPISLSPPPSPSLIS